MKKILLFFAVSSFLLSCSGNDDGNSCGKLSGFDITQENEKLNITLTSDDNSEALYYELSYQPTGNGDKPDNGQRITLNSLSESIAFTNFLAPGQAYVFFVRPVCDDSHAGKWSAAKTLLINDFCNLPKDPQFGFSGVQAEFEWDYNVSESNTSYYQVEYGLEGFSLGNGTRTNLNNNYYSGMSLQAGQIYDFYVRSYCNTSLGWSSWVGPITHLSVSNQNLCLPPTNVNYEIQSISGSYATINFQWNFNGENTSEYALVAHGETPTPATIHTITAGTGTPTYTSVYRYGGDYDFCVRNVCQDGIRTAWTKKLVDL